MFRGHILLQLLDLLLVDLVLLVLLAVRRFDLVRLAHGNSSRGPRGLSSIRYSLSSTEFFLFLEFLLDLREELDHVVGEEQAGRHDLREDLQQIAGGQQTFLQTIVQEPLV